MDTANKITMKLLGHLANTKEWFFTTIPAVALMADGKVQSAWEAKPRKWIPVLKKLAGIIKGYVNDDVGVKSRVQSFKSPLTKRK